MNIENYREFCISKKGVTEEFPFDSSTLVFKVMGKMFALTDIELFASINIKCDPDLAIDLRERYPSVLPGYHMNKRHWNTIIIDGSLTDQELKDWINHSYDLVVPNLTKTLKQVLIDL